MELDCLELSPFISFRAVASNLKITLHDVLNVFLERDYPLYANIGKGAYSPKKYLCNRTIDPNLWATVYKGSVKEVCDGEQDKTIIRELPEELDERLYKICPSNSSNCACIPKFKCEYLFSIRQDEKILVWEILPNYSGSENKNWRYILRDNFMPAMMFLSYQVPIGIDNLFAKSHDVKEIISNPWMSLVAENHMECRA